MVFKKESIDRYGYGYKQRITSNVMTAKLTIQSLVSLNHPLAPVYLGPQNGLAKRTPSAKAAYKEYVELNTLEFTVFH